MNDKTIFITGGGTGGHIYPAVAIFEELSKSIAPDNIFYIGNPKNLEREVASKYGINFLPISVSGMPRKLSFRFAIWCIQLLLAIVKSIFYLIKFKPSVIIGTGGYVAFPILAAGIILRKPCYIHDSDAHPGIVSRVIAPFASKVSLAFEDAKKFINSSKIVVNGNPLRSSLSKVTKQEAAKSLGLSAQKKTVLVMGGSQGAKSINDALLGSVEKLVSKGLQVVHQTGQKNYEDVVTLVPQIDGYLVKPYFEDMTDAYSVADLVVARAGSLSLSELNNCALPAVLVPYPHAAADHQRYNAKAMESQGAALYLEDADCSPDKLETLILDNIFNEQKLQAMSEASSRLAKPNATVDFVNLVLEEI